jgi:alpha-L-fucosidase
VRKLAAAALISALVGAAQTYERRVTAALATVGQTVAKGPFAANWESLSTYNVPAWYLDAKFGIFIHWGAYSVPAFGSEWYPRNMYQADQPEFQHHIQTFGPQLQFGYKDFIPRFQAENFKPAEWASLFRKAGAKYVVPVAEHHDGFPMYDCSFTDWSAVKMGPRRDVVGELAVAVRAEGLVLGVSSHRAEHWWFFDGGRKFPSDVQDPKNAGLYAPAHPEKTGDGKSESAPDAAFLNDWLARTTELVDKYHPQLIWFDWWIEQPVFQPYLQRFAAFYYNRGAEWNKGVAINYKKQSFPARAAVLDIERGKLDKVRSQFWQTDTSVGLKSWGYIQDEKFRTADSLVDDLIDIVSKNGALLLNIGPRPDGTIPEEVQGNLLAIGRWLSVNGEAIYGTRPFEIYGEGPTEVLAGGFTDAKSQPFTGQDIRYTTKGNTLYAIALDWPGTELTARSLGTNGPLKSRRIRSITLLGSQAKLKWKQTEDALTVRSPARSGEFAFVYKIEFD